MIFFFCYNIIYCRLLFWYILHRFSSFSWGVPIILEGTLGVKTDRPTGRCEKLKRTNQHNVSWWDVEPLEELQSYLRNKSLEQYRRDEQHWWWWRWRTLSNILLQKSSTGVQVGWDLTTVWCSNVFILIRVELLICSDSWFIPSGSLSHHRFYNNS